MSEQKKFAVLRKVLGAIGLSQNRIDELIARIQEWLSEDQIEKAGVVQYPYHLRDDFLSPAELNFYRVLQTAVSDWAVVFTKVSLGDLFFAQAGDRSKNQAYRNKIDRKHVDFLLCDPQTIKPILGVELDDKSHQRPDRQKRDVFVNGVFSAASLPLAHVQVQRNYSAKKLDQFLKNHLPASGKNGKPPQEQKDKSKPPVCPKCGAEMKLRTAKSGKNKGNRFWGCSNYPKCRSIVPFEG